VDKRKPTYQLRDVKKLITQGKKATPNWKVMQSAQEIGFSLDQAYDEILNLDSEHFYKSTTEKFNPQVWYDVYKKKIGGNHVYIKFKIVSDTSQFLLSSFKEDTEKSSK
jgi:hypothetical protein